MPVHFILSGDTLQSIAEQINPEKSRFIIIFLETDKNEFTKHILSGFWRLMKFPII